MSAQRALRQGVWDRVRFLAGSGDVHGVGTSSPFSSNPSPLGPPPLRPDLHWEVVERILFLYAKLNPGVGYVQGMNEVLGPIYYVLATDSDPKGRANAEADAFFCFTALMSDARDHFLRSLDGDAGSGIGASLRRLERRVARRDPGLWSSLQRKQVASTYYAFRWLTVLCTQEWPLPDLIRLWDSVISDPPPLHPRIPDPPVPTFPLGADENLGGGDDRSQTPYPSTPTHLDPVEEGTEGEERFAFLLDFCTAMLLCVRDALIEGGFADNVKLLQNYPIDDVGTVLAKAYEIREADEAESLAAVARSERSATRSNLSIRSWISGHHPPPSLLGGGRASLASTTSTYASTNPLTSPTLSMEAPGDPVGGGGSSFFSNSSMTSTGMLPSSPSGWSMGGGVSSPMWGADGGCDQEEDADEDGLGVPVNRARTRASSFMDTVRAKLPAALHATFRRGTIASTASSPIASSPMSRGSEGMRNGYNTPGSRSGSNDGDAMDDNEDSDDDDDDDDDDVALAIGMRRHRDGAGMKGDGDALDSPPLVESLPSPGRRPITTASASSSPTSTSPPPLPLPPPPPRRRIGSVASIRSSDHPSTYTSSPSASSSTRKMRLSGMDNGRGSTVSSSSSTATSTPSTSSSPAPPPLPVTGIRGISHGVAYHSSVRDGRGLEKAGGLMGRSGSSPLAEPSITMVSRGNEVSSSASSSRYGGHPR
ncbi:rab-GTPase-TBC domain-containing protein [Piptocephalis cylindrospora]|uniref:Rab-GTPase-TBC domain-containing protein n=1 Tax=Piptocephalis cylindrospora TaxID=1907219 RepID=A0A4P9Y3N8_9FUNG|nr:rab-GTPase-TBC domain-containing protein [Piptocephalis cylindrospora]|eukprot:RKP12741.1 rab-GTPase-TBC domain-containing protein [Piptocephalis cylindrospora]